VRDALKATALALATLAVAVAAGCAQAADRSAPTSGCTEEASVQMYVERYFDCSDTSIYTFKTKEDRDAWLTIAKLFGNVAVDSGETWLKIKN